MLAIAGQSAKLSVWAKREGFHYMTTSFCARVYGRRGARSRATAAVNAAKRVTI